ncbi:hypothetical protein GGI43DRAFT_412269 [Trichoderma evansii]
MHRRLFLFLACNPAADLEHYLLLHIISQLVNIYHHQFASHCCISLHEATANCCFASSAPKPPPLPLVSTPDLQKSATTPPIRGKKNQQQSSTRANRLTAREIPRRPQH